ncbi:hypothetical protein [Streptomyces chattanoogensis]|uniref:hypothetical protein n=1 Tax=Streptomyces chattanoogensis TaxID=66876 RepID=UPI00369EB37E
MELHELLKEWEEAAQQTYELLFESRGWTHDKIRESLRYVNISVHLPLGGGFLERHEGDIKCALDAKTPLLHRWSGKKRRQAARRNLRSLMGIYCPELLADFETAVHERSEWVRENRRLILQHVKAGTPPTLAEVVGREAMQTATNISAVRMQLATLILERYPLGAAPAE